eukprot:TRINITY_DN43962_c2_g1_i1.p1 TRINITY_DN43962_c2_g1~~TRINITY_DN43962_c2_g1_i1.p1  ORF type:complete len:204 (+),score=12.59 TRINITY_DN43962_c2_g1_i1:78-689(+)
MAPKRRRVGKLQRACVKTRLCRFYVGDGLSCNLGENCLFAHTAEELCDVPDLSGTRLCQMYAEGSCEAGVKCSFAHGEGALRPSPQQAVADLQNEVVRARAASFGGNNEQVEDFVPIPRGSMGSSSLASAIPSPHAEDIVVLKAAHTPRHTEAMPTVAPCRSYPIAVTHQLPALSCSLYLRGQRRSEKLSTCAVTAFTARTPS